MQKDELRKINACQRPLSWRLRGVATHGCGRTCAGAKPEVAAKPARQPQPPSLQLLAAKPAPPSLRLLAGKPVQQSLAGRPPLLLLAAKPACRSRASGPKPLGSDQRRQLRLPQLQVPKMPLTLPVVEEEVLCSRLPPHHPTRPMNCSRLPPSSMQSAQGGAKPARFAQRCQPGAGLTSMPSNRVLGARTARRPSANTSRRTPASCDHVFRTMRSSLKLRGPKPWRDAEGGRARGKELTLKSCKPNKQMDAVHTWCLPATSSPKATRLLQQIVEPAGSMVCPIYIRYLSLPGQQHRWTLVFKRPWREACAPFRGTRSLPL